ncbi:cysteine desufuration protein SufE [Candidatus Regiella insecticola LSR1]|uniref:Cysteine desufuration protein SufE n=2 Tax=Candidatus Regiella insecticola TaxID=138073 RepID=E0WTV0_9ENTR|nr:cysteine desufuration protein SufE [Candidatus Regiella insecticola LSR1]
MTMSNLPNKEKLIRNFSRCHDWEEKYLYIIELGAQLPALTAQQRHPNNLINGCQSQVWIEMTLAEDGTVLFAGDSDAAIVKGLVVMVFSLYQHLLPQQIIKLDIKSFFADLELSQHLTPGRSQGLEAMVRTIRARAECLCMQTNV